MACCVDRNRPIPSIVIPSLISSPFISILATRKNKHFTSGHWIPNITAINSAIHNQRFALSWAEGPTTQISLVLLRCITARPAPIGPWEPNAITPFQVFIFRHLILVVRMVSSNDSATPNLSATRVIFG